MGKKHKKHHKLEKKSRDEEKFEKEPLSLKLVLRKIDMPESDSDVYSHSPHPETKKHKHKKKKKKKSSEKEKRRHHDEERPRKRHREDTEEEPDVSQDDEEDMRPAPPKKQMLEEVETEDTMEEDIEVAEDRPEPVSAAPRDEEHGVLRIFLKYLQDKLQRKDTNGFFAFPVSDLIAPGYSNIITTPMDFSTMLTKVDAHEYRNVMEYKRDFIMMCNNAMTYNRPETIYYKEAKRLLHIGMKTMSMEKLMVMKRTLPFLASLTADELGRDEPYETRVVMEAIAEEERMEKKRAKAREGLGRYEAIPDNLTPEEILAQAKSAAKEAAEMLTLRKPKCNYAFLRQRDDGSTSLCMMNPDNDGIVSETERVINLGSLIGKLTSGTGQLMGVKEDKRNKVTPVNYMNYGPFSSYAPQFDSTFSNITKEESDLLLSTYGDETGVQYAKSLADFTENCGDYATAMVDNLLDILTKGEHNKLKKQQEEKLKKEDENSNTVSTGTDQKDMSNVPKDPVQVKLDHTASLINDLQQTQYERLSSRLPQHLAQVPGPSEKELQLAQEVTKELKELAKEATPSAVVSTQGLRSAMGINFQPIESTSTNFLREPSVQIASQMEDNKLQQQEVPFTTNENPADIVDEVTNQNPSNVNMNDNDSEEIDISEFLQMPAQMDLSGMVTDTT